MQRIKDELLASVLNLADQNGGPCTVWDYRKTPMGEIACVVEQELCGKRLVRWYCDGKRIATNRII